MKKIFTICSLLALMSVNANAQSAYDAAALNQKDLNGTARFVGMGGAMGALGGDLSTISTNPAGIGIYRSNDVMMTYGYSINQTESDFGGKTFKAGKNQWSLDNVGAVFSTKFGNRTSLKYVNFGFSYHKSKSFYRNMTMQGLMGEFEGQYISQVRHMAQQATNNQVWLYDTTGEQFDFDKSEIYKDPDAGWLGAMGFQGWLTEEYGDNAPFGYDPVIPNEVYGTFLSRERGGIDAYDFNVAFNMNDRFYLGFTIGAYSVDYNKYSFYDEDYGNGEGYSLESFNRIHGGGFDFKLGTIIRPFEYSPLRIGLSVHTPTFYSLTYTTGALLNSEVLVTDETTGQEKKEHYLVDTYRELGNRDMDRDFHLQTPWVFNASLGYTVGNYLALGAEYEYEDYASMEFEDPDGYEMGFETDEVGLCLKDVHTFRVGAEFKPIPQFALRAGYNYSSSIFRDDAIKALPDNSINTDTDFSNTKSSSIYTLGIGYKGSKFYADVAYKYHMYDSDFYAFYNEIGNRIVTTPATKVKNSRGQVLLTLGVRF